MTETMEYWAAEELGESELSNLHACEGKIAYNFRDLRFLHQALTHSSIKTLENPSNERLEFLGDSVLGLVMTEFLYNFFQQHNEGDLTQIKSVVVSTNVLAAESQRLGLGEHYNVGKGVTRRKKLPNSLLANVFEAVVAAMDRNMLSSSVQQNASGVLLNLSASGADAQSSIVQAGGIESIV